MKFRNSKGALFYLPVFPLYIVIHNYSYSTSLPMSSQNGFSLEWGSTFHIPHCTYLRSILIVFRLSTIHCTCSLKELVDHFFLQFFINFLIKEKNLSLNVLVVTFPRILSRAGVLLIWRLWFVRCCFLQSHRPSRCILTFSYKKLPCKVYSLIQRVQNEILQETHSM